MQTEGDNERRTTDGHHMFGQHTNNAPYIGTAGKQTGTTIVPNKRYYKQDELMTLEKNERLSSTPSLLDEKITLNMPVENQEEDT